MDVPTPTPPPLPPPPHTHTYHHHHHRHHYHVFPRLGKIVTLSQLNFNLDRSRKLREFFSANHITYLKGLCHEHT